MINNKIIVVCENNSVVNNIVIVSENNSVVVIINNVNTVLSRTMWCSDRTMLVILNFVLAVMFAGLVESTGEWSEDAEDLGKFLCLYR